MREEGGAKPEVGGEKVDPEWKCGFGIVGVFTL